MTTFLDYWNSLTTPQKAAIAEQVGSKPIYLYQIAAGLRKPGPDMAKKLHRASGFVVSLNTLRPDIWDAA